MKLQSLRADNTKHREWSKVDPIPGEPWAFYIAPGNPVTEADGSNWSSPFPVVSLFWPERYFQVFLLLKSDVTEYYCNVITPPTYVPEEGCVQFIDLDLDLIKSHNSVRIADEEEFEERKHSYPHVWIENAKEAIHTLSRMATQEIGPFSPATADRWRAWSQTRLDEQ